MVKFLADIPQMRNQLSMRYEISITITFIFDMVIFERTFNLYGFIIIFFISFIETLRSLISMSASTFFLLLAGTSMDFANTALLDLGIGFILID